MSSERYASNFLFGRYLVKRWGGNKALRAFLPQISIKECDSNIDSQASNDIVIFFRIQNILVAMEASHELQIRSTISDVLRHFAIALVLNVDETASQGLYSIPGWNGFSSSPITSMDKMNFSYITLELGSFIRLDYKLWSQNKSNWSQELEVYRIVTFKDGSYDLLTRDQIQNKVKEIPLQDTVTLLNASKRELLPLLH